MSFEKLVPSRLKPDPDLTLPHTHKESHLGVFGCEMGVLWPLVAFSDIFYTGDKLYTMSPLVRDPTHCGLPMPQQYVLHLTWLVTGQGLRIIFAELKRRSHWVDVSIINQRRISPTQCLPC